MGAEQVSAAASTYGLWSLLIIGGAIVVGVLAANWQRIKSLAAQAKPAADPIAEALDIARQLDALHQRLGLTTDERQKAFHAVLDRGFEKAKAEASK